MIGKRQDSSFVNVTPPTTASPSTTTGTPQVSTTNSVSTTTNAVPAAPKSSASSSTPSNVNAQQTESSTSIQSTSATTVNPAQSTGNSGQSIHTHCTLSDASGAAAGVAIGSIIAGAAIASLILILFFRRKKANRQVAPAYAQHVAPTQTEKEAVTTTTHPVAVIDSYLPQPAADDAILGELSRLRDNIKNHAKSYYHTSPVDGAMVDGHEVQVCAQAAGMPSQKLQELFLNPETRIAAIRLYLSWLILSRCEGRDHANGSFLPAEVAAFAPLIAGLDYSNAGQVALASKWKAISGTLLQSRYGSQNPGSPSNDVVSHSIQSAIAEADSFLGPFVGSSGDDKRLRNLEGILHRAAKFAFLLFSQPSSLSFNWASGSNQGRIVIFPGLLQTVTDEGHVQRPARVLSDAEVI